MILRQFPTGESSIDREKYVWGKLRITLLTIQKINTQKINAIFFRKFHTCSGAAPIKYKSNIAEKKHLALVSWFVNLLLEVEIQWQNHHWIYDPHSFWFRFIDFV